MADTESRLLNNLKMCMRDFHPGKDAIKDYSSVYGLKVIGMESSDPPLPYMVLLTLVGLLGFAYYGREEKIAWSIPLVYKDTPFMVSHQKFGLRIAAVTDDNTDDNEVKALGKQMVKQLARGIRIADKLLTPVVAERVKLGEVSVVNKHHMMHDAYTYFRERARDAFEKSDKPPSVNAPMEKVFRGLNKKIQWERKGFYYTRAMLDAFYSWLEHVLILLLPFRDFDRTAENLEDLMRSDWTTKYNRVLSSDTDTDAMRVYNQLQEIKEKYRNCLTHGFFDKSGASLLAHMPTVGAIPVSLSSYRNSIHYSSFFPITQDAFREICSAFDNLEQILLVERFQRPFRIIEAGLDICFDDASLREYKQAIESPQNVEAFVDKMTYLSDKCANMDW